MHYQCGKSSFYPYYLLRRYVEFLIVRIRKHWNNLDFIISGLNNKLSISCNELNQYFYIKNFFYQSNWKPLATWTLVSVPHIMLQRNNEHYSHVLNHLSSIVLKTISYMNSCYRSVHQAQRNNIHIVTY